MYDRTKRTGADTLNFEPTSETCVEHKLSGSEMLAQHEELLLLIDEIEGALSVALTDDSEALRAQLARRLTLLIGLLKTHFAAEGKSLESDFEDAPELRAVFRILDSEHPQLLKHFHNALGAIDQNRNIEEAAQLVQTSIDLFRDHEAREDALFASG